MLQFNPKIITEKTVQKKIIFLRRWMCLVFLCLYLNSIPYKILCSSSRIYEVLFFSSNVLDQMYLAYLFVFPLCVSIFLGIIGNCMKVLHCHKPRRIALSQCHYKSLPFTIQSPMTSWSIGSLHISKQQCMFVCIAFSINLQSINRHFEILKYSRIFVLCCLFELLLSLFLLTPLPPPLSLFLSRSLSPSPSSTASSFSLSPFVVLCLSLLSLSLAACLQLWPSLCSK